MLERDDDDDVFEEAEAAAFDAREEARAAASQGNVDPEDDLLPWPFGTYEFGNLTGRAGVYLYDAEE